MNVLFDIEKIFIRRMEINDLGKVLPITSLSIQSPWSENMFIEEITNPLAYCFVIQLKDDFMKSPLLGFMCFRNILEESELFNICVHPRYRKLGLGRKLMQFYIDFCNQKKIKTFYLEVDSSNQPAIHLYQIFSYRMVSIRKKFYQGKFDALLMIKEA